MHHMFDTRLCFSVPAIHISSPLITNLSVQNHTQTIPAEITQTAKMPTASGIYPRTIFSSYNLYTQRKIMPLKEITDLKNK